MTAANARIEGTKTGPRPIWLGPEAVKLIAALPARRHGVVFPKDLPSRRLYTFWCGVREEVGIPAFASSHP